MLRKWRMWILLAGLLLGAAACGGTAPAEAPVQPATTVPTSASADVPAATVAMMPTPTVEEMVEAPTTPPTEQPAAAAIPDRPSAPASPDQYRDDPEALVGATGNPQLVEFFTYWCPTCRALRPMVHGLEAEYWGQVDFVYIDREAEDNQTVTRRFGVRSQPILVLLDPEGNELERWFGYVSEEELRAGIDAYLASAG